MQFEGDRLISSKTLDDIYQRTASSDKQGMLLPLLGLPKKHSQDCSWEAELKKQIIANYEDDPAKYLDKIMSLDRMRREAIRAEPSILGRNLILSYYAQLEVLDLHFKFNTFDSSLSFTWSDAFSNSESTQVSVDFEKASILFSLASIYSQLALSSNRNTEMGLKQCCNYLQFVGSIFHHIHETFFNAPTMDLSKDACKILQDLMLCQAQECLVTKAVNENMKSSNISKLSAHLAAQYRSIAVSFKGTDYYPEEFEIFCAMKSLIFDVLSQIHSALHAELAGNFGIAIARLQTAQTMVKDSEKANVSWISGDARPEWAISALSSLQATLSQRLPPMEKHNDLIYHQAIPSSVSLEKIAPLSLTKIYTIKDIYMDAKDLDIIDLFASLISLNIHMQLSQYSELKDAFYRECKAQCNDHDNIISVKLASFNISSIFQQLSSIDDNRNYGAESRRILDEVRSSDLSCSFSSMINSWLDIIKEMGENLRYISFGLDNELKEWNQAMASNQTLPYQSGKETDMIKGQLNEFAAKYNNLCSEHEALYSSYNNDQNLQDRILDYSSKPILSRPVDLLDDSISLTSPSNMASNLQKYQNMLIQSKSNHARILGKLKEELQKDDIKDLLVLNPQANEQELFAQELRKHTHFKTELGDVMNVELEICFKIEEILKLFKMKDGYIQQHLQDNAQLKQLSDLYDLWKERRKIYRDYNDRIIKFNIDLSNFLRSTSDFFVQRSTERQNSKRHALNSVNVNSPYTSAPSNLSQPNVEANEKGVSLLD